MAEYLASKNPQYYDNNILVQSVLLARQKCGSPIEMQGCMKQHLIIFKPNGKYFCKGYLCVVNPVWILTLKIAKMTILMLRLQIRVLKKNFLMRRLIKRNKFFILSQCCHSFLCILEVQSSHSILSKLLEKVLPTRTFLITTDTLSQKWEILSRFYLKLVRSRNAKVKRFYVLPTRIAITPDKIYDTYIDFNDDLELDIYVYNMLIRKASCWDFMFFVP